MLNEQRFHSATVHIIKTRRSTVPRISHCITRPSTVYTQARCLRWFPVDNHRVVFFSIPRTTHRAAISLSQRPTFRISHPSVRGGCIYESLAERSSDCRVFPEFARWQSTRSAGQYVGQSGPRFASSGSSSPHWLSFVCPLLAGSDPSKASPANQFIGLVVVVLSSCNSIRSRLFAVGCVLLAVVWPQTAGKLITDPARAGPYIGQLRRSAVNSNRRERVTMRRNGRFIGTMVFKVEPGPEEE